MSNSALVTVVLPVFCFIGLGYAIIASRLLTDRAGEAMADFVFTIAVPMLLFRALGTLAMPDVNPWPFWGAYFGGIAVNIAIGYVIVRRAFKRDARVGVIAGMSASYSNVVMVGMPIITQAFGDPGLVTVFLLIAVHLPVMTTVSAIMIELTDIKDGHKADIPRALVRVVKTVLMNPFIIAIILGVLFRFTGLPLEGIPRIVIDRVSDTAIPLALISLGMSLHKYGIRGSILPAVAIGAVKLLVMPIVVFALAQYVFGLSELGVAVAVISAACPTGANAYLIANRFQTGLAISANTITLSTLLSVLTIGFWLSHFLHVI
ncbi:AEC family transporter [Acuticoccus sp. MNP-M23]|uniref:AEC family transporter n=1 Tax=Acuticoccus sp. MNP-M23 TaxID=3072793 RepID=UPI0028169738|nr:AEC family transporter [Acuticoccus sp. MNP-M23]WMS41560.1 AEC family transporter [Acuticoccus sp. MNP-M23]